jgi:hypothetical protein
MTVHQKTVPISLPENIPGRIRSLLPTALKLIERCFPGTQHIRGAMASDPVVDEEWLELHVALHGEAEELLEADTAFGRNWVTAVPFPDHHLIRVFPSPL